MPLTTTLRQAMGTCRRGLPSLSPPSVPAGSRSLICRPLAGSGGRSRNGHKNDHDDGSTASTGGGGGGSQRRCFGSGGGSRGARGHGWWINYRAGGGGRHLQGEYGHLDVDALAAWNDAVLSLGSRIVYMDVRSESVSSSSTSAPPPPGGGGSNAADDGDGDDVQIHRLKIQLATAVLPMATDNFIKLLQAGAGVGYAGSTLYRVEKQVGLMGGLVWTGGVGAAAGPSRKVPAPVGRCHPDYAMPTSLTAMDVESEALVLSHVPGVITMLMPRVHEVDSRFLLCSHHAPHLDGKAVAIGRLADGPSMETVRRWEGTLITQKGRPTNVALRIVGCGLLEEEDDGEADKATQATAAAMTPTSAAETENKVLSES